MVAFIARAVMARAVLRKVPAMSIRSHNSAQSGFTLMEMLVVLSIMAVVAGVGVQALNGMTNDVEDGLARTEMNTIASAIQRFHADTGYWPKEGPFAGDDEDNYDHPANMKQLRVAPYGDHDDESATADELILPFDTASGTGWHGPYMRELDAVTVSVGSMNTDGSGDPSNGSDVRVSGLGDPFSADAANGTHFVWRDAMGEELRLGRPYLYFIDDDANTTVAGCQVPCLVSFGSNGDYDAGANDDIVVNIAGG